MIKLNIEKNYHPKEIEKKWSDIWEKGECFSPKTSGVPYCIMIPPPNVTGSLHMGHAFQDTIMDSLIRYHRMRGFQTLWQVGTDHAGIATQMIVERQLLAKKLTKHDLGRKKFVNRIWKWKKESGNIITQQLRRLGASVDWSRECFTMDPALSKTVQTVFIKLYQEGLIYRGKRLVNWDPVLRTAISDLEVTSEEESGNLWHIRYPIENSDQKFIITTTRPETVLCDTAVAVHPDDERYQAFIGKQISLPITNRLIPIIADEYVDPAFGTGCVKITPAHDFNDYEVGKRHNLPLINIFTMEGKVNGNAPISYQGLDRFEARNYILNELEDFNFLEKTEPYILKVPRGDRSRAIIEPYLTDQWFVKIDSLAKPAIDAVKKGHVKFVPENWSKTYFEWMYNIQDWCISRQLWWGHRIPAWYDSEGNIYVAKNKISARKQYNLSSELELTQDNDVLDTWFSSALWPFSTLGWPESTKALKTFYPTSVLVTGFDIIFFWVARMIMFGLKLTKKIPFHIVYIHGLIQDRDGQKMSKSKGNVLDPIDLIDGVNLNDLIAKRTSSLMQPDIKKSIEVNTRKEFSNGISAYGADALRFTFCALATTGRYIRFDLARVEGYRNFCNKIWNAARYVLINTDGHALDLKVGAKDYSIADKWILSRWQHVKAIIIEHFDKYRFDLVAQDIYEFTWNEYCDWYLEYSKVILYGREISDAQIRGTRLTLLQVLEELLCVLHPIMPFITEEIWQKITSSTMRTTCTLIEYTFPTVKTELIDKKVELIIEWTKTFIIGIRNIRGEMNISPNKLLPLIIFNASEKDKSYIHAYFPFLQSLAKIESFTFVKGEEDAPLAATSLVGNMKLFIPISGLIDKKVEIIRLQKEIDKCKKSLLRSEHKLDNPSYVNKAPKDVIEKERNRVSRLKISIDSLEGSLKSVGSI